jgi:hypothetical protein
MLDDLLENFSYAGVIFALLTAGLVFALRKWMLNPFLQHMGTGAAYFWMIATYGACLVVGYLVGTKLFEDY